VEAGSAKDQADLFRLLREPIEERSSVISEEAWWRRWWKAVAKSHENRNLRKRNASSRDAHHGCTCR
jgi:hypothetical protein